MACQFEPRPPTIGDVLAVPGAVWRLAMARLALRRVGATDILTRNASAALRAAAAPARPLAGARAAKVFPWAARFVPWRADCLVQAMAAQEWLAKRGTESRIVLGIDRGGTGIEPHAWLEASKRIVTGGPVDRYTVFLGEDAGGVVAARPQSL